MSQINSELPARRVVANRAARARAQSAAQDALRLASGFAAMAARSDDMPALQNEVCRVAAAGLRVGFAKLLVYDPDRRDFLVQAGVGWREGVVGHARLYADVGTAAGFTWRSGESVIANSLVTQLRFRVPDVLAQHAIASTINVAVSADADTAFGVLEVESPDPGRFVAEDVYFIASLAHSLASALGRAARRQDYEEQIARQAAEYKLMLQEMQHRIRNDLQVICSVASQERRLVADPAETIGIERIIRRVFALAHLYDHLLDGQAVGQIDLGAYLQSLCGKIAAADELSDAGITIDVDAARLVMQADRVVRLGVAVNELVANAVRHAFGGAAGGRITVTLAATGNDGRGPPELSVADDGCGFTEPNPGRLGMSFVEELTRQAGGVLEREHAKGTLWRIRL